MLAGRKKAIGATSACIDHIGIDAEYGLIRRYAVTDASVHDSQVLGQLLDEDNQADEIWADSAYRSQGIEEAHGLMPIGLQPGTASIASSTQNGQSKRAKPARTRHPEPYATVGFPVFYGHPLRCSERHSADRQSQ